MRSASLLGVTALAVLVGSAAPARTEPYDAQIQQDTDVRSGHGDGAMFYTTNQLHAGDRVRVVGQADGGWLAIVPPSGSFSWIRKDVLYVNNQQQPPVTVANEDTDVRIGSAMTKQTPVVGKRVPRGTLVTILPPPNNREVQDADGTWAPIYPPEGEVRYIRAEAIQAPPAAQNAPAVAGAPLAGIPTANPPAAPAQDAETLYRKAIDAERLKPLDAVALYNQGAAVDSDFNRATQARNRANWLRDSQYNPTQNIVPGVPPGADPHAVAAPNESTVHPLAGDVPPSVHLAPPQGMTVGQTTTSGAAPGSAAQYATTPGYLKKSGRNLESRKTYMMISDHGSPFYYVTAEPGVNLDQYVDKRVECYGEAIYNSDLRANYMRVSRVEPRPAQ